MVSSKNECSPKKNFSFEDITAIVDRHSDCEKITITGGEPFLRTDITDIFSYIKRNNPSCQIEVQTNGTMLKDKSLVAESKKHVDCFFVALHSYRKSTHDTICGRDGSWDDTLEGFANLINNDCAVSTQTVISRLNMPDLISTFDFFHDVGLHDNWLTFPHPNGNAYKYFPIVVPKLSEVEPIIAAITSSHPNVNVISVPACHLPSYGRYRECELNAYRPSDEKNINCIELTNARSDHEPDEDFISQIQREFNKNEKCGTCIYNDRCLGVWKEYLEYYDDLRPVHDHP